jgi:hypothetical protein
VGEVVDLDGYTEICLGLTGWTIGYDVAFQNYRNNMIDPWAEPETSEEEVLEADGAVTIRSRTTATHVGEFLEVPPTGRRVSGAIGGDGGPRPVSQTGECAKGGPTLRARRRARAPRGGGDHDGVGRLAIRNVGEVEHGSARPRACALPSSVRGQPAHPSGAWAACCRGVSLDLGRHLAAQQQRIATEARLVREAIRLRDRLKGKDSGDSRWPGKWKPPEPEGPSGLRGRLYPRSWTMVKLLIEGPSRAVATRSRGRRETGGHVMKAIVQDRYGSAEVLEFRDVGDPAMGEADVLVRVRAAGCGPDVWH